MKIVVDKLPVITKDCLFCSEFVGYGEIIYSCKLSGDRCGLCSGDGCPYLTTTEVLKEEQYGN